MNDYDKWLFFPLKKERAKVRLFCFSYAGGGSSIFYKWPESMGDIEVVSVRLPGRERRIREKPYTAMDELVFDFLPILETFYDKPFAFYGHSLGGLITFELSRQLQKSERPMPAHLFVASTYAPHVAHSRQSFHYDPDDQFLRKVMEYGGLSQQLLNDKSLVRLMLPILRADFQIIANYVCKANDKLNIPITVLGGLEDRIITRHELGKWREYTTFNLEMKLFAGGHFFLETSSEKLLKFIHHRLIRV
jgi:medium-chain acyl-[acyl-carrier-protein] hydrolase